MNAKPYDVFCHCWPSSDVPSAACAGEEDVADDLGDKDVLHFRFGVLGFHSKVDYPEDDVGQYTRCI